MLKKAAVYQALKRVAESRLVDSSPKDIKVLALAYWHEGFVPEERWLEQLDQGSRLVVGYVSEFLAGFNVLCHEERKNLLHFPAN